MYSMDFGGSAKVRALWNPEAVLVQRRQIKRIQFLKRTAQRWGRRYTYQDLIRILRNEVQFAKRWTGDGQVTEPVSDPAVLVTNVL